MPKIAKVIIILICLALMVLAVHKSKTEYDEYGAVFNRIYATNAWSNGSGWGSDPQHAAPYMQLLQAIFNDPKYTSIVDYGCGDWQMMRRINIPQDTDYYGFDVSTLVLKNNKQYEKSNVHFYTTNDIAEFAMNGPSGDVIVVKDVLQHLPNADVQYFIDRILPKYKYALITNDFESSKPDSSNKDIPVGSYRPLQLREPPFNLQNTEILMEYRGPEHKQVLLYTNPNN